MQKLLIVYSVLYTLPFPFNYLPDPIGKYFEELITGFWTWLVPFVSHNLYGIEGKVEYISNGSGDSLYYYLLMPTTFFLSIILAALWFFIYRKFHYQYDKINKIFQIYIAYYLSFTLFVYGFAKVFYLQFTELSLFALTQSFGDSSPMGLLWKFMGYSEPYTVFVGLMEVFAGILLLFGKTRLLGAMTSLIILIQVFVLNLSFDVPVKIYSFHLILFSIVLLWSDLKRLMNFFLLNKIVEPAPRVPLFENGWKRRVGQVSKYIVVFIALYGIVSEDIKRQSEYGKRAPSNLLYGVYDVNLFIVNMDTVPPSRTNFERWDRLIIDKNSAMIEKMNREKVYFKMEIDSINSKVFFASYFDQGKINEFEFHIKGDYLVLEGEMKNEQVTAKMSKKNRSDFFLEQRGFHWINEYPMNR